MSARIRFGPRIIKQKNMCFFSAQRAHQIVADFREKNSQFREIKKNISKKTSLFRKIKNIFPAMFFFVCFFRRPH